MSFNLQIPRVIGTALELKLAAGEVYFLLGANGTGKSSLLHRFYTANHSSARRITAHRQTWFELNAIKLFPPAEAADREQYSGTRHKPPSKVERVRSALTRQYDHIRFS